LEKGGGFAFGEDGGIDDAGWMFVENYTLRQSVAQSRETLRSGM